jgi:hypothetical protein
MIKLIPASCLISALLILGGCTAQATLLGTLPTGVVGDQVRQPSGQNPVIQSFTASPSNSLKPGQNVTFQVVTFDPEGAPLQFNWAYTGGTISSTAGQVVVWMPPKEAGTYAIQVIVTNGNGGVASASQNLIVTADGATITPGATSVPTPTPAIVPSSDVTSTNGAALVYGGNAFMSIEDNDDEVIQRGETVLLQPKLKNVGTSKTDGVKAVVSTDDPYAEVTDRSLPYGKPQAIAYQSIGPGEACLPWGNGGFRLTVSSKCPSGHEIAFVMSVEDKYGNKWDSPFTVTIP